MDLAHLRYVHGYDNVKRIEPVSVDGTYLQSRFDFRSTRAIARFATLNFDLSANAHIFGLGYSFVDIHERSIGMDVRLWVLATPVDGTLIDLSLVSQVRELRSPRRWIAGLGFLPQRLRAPVMNRFIASQQLQDVFQDVVIWSPQTVRLPAASLPLRRRDHDLSNLLQPVLPLRCRRFRAIQPLMVAVGCL